MSVTIRGTDNSASTPAVSGTDGDTGVFFPAANQVALSTNGTQAVLVDSSQNVGIKTSTPGTDLQVNDTTAMGTGSAVADILSVTNNNAVVSGVAGDRLGIVMSAMSDLSDRRVGLYCRAQNANFNNPDFSIFQTGQGIAFRETLRVTADSSATLRFNSGYGSVAAAYGCRAWVNFDGTGTVAIRASGNVSSITDDGTGSYTVNLTNAMPDGNFSATLSSGTNSSGGINAYTAVISSTSAIAVYTYSIAGGGSGAYRDTASVLFAVFR